MTRIAHAGDNSTERRLQAERLVGATALQEAQALRYKVFSAEFQAKLKGAELGLDMDDYDIHCRHIGVRDLATGQLVATTRLLDHQAASSLGRFYSEEEFSLHGLLQLQGPILELGRTCVDPAYRNGGTIAVLWGELAEVLNEGRYNYLMGCASIPMQDGGVQATYADVDDLIRDTNFKPGGRRPLAVVLKMTQVVELRFHVHHQQPDFAVLQPVEIDSK